MWFKQIQLFSIKKVTHFNPEFVEDALSQLPFSPCLPLLPVSFGWVPPQEDDNTPLVFSLNQCVMICLQTEEKILPATVISQHVDDKVKQIEYEQERKVSQKEKKSLKDEAITTLMPKAFTRRKKLHAYIDTRLNILVLNSANKKEIDLFLNAWKKVLPEQTLKTIAVKNPALILSHWVLNGTHPREFSINNACVLFDEQEKNRIIRFQQQPLHSQSVQLLLKDGCAVSQLALTWQDQLNFTLTENFVIRSISLEKALTEDIAQESETKEARFQANFAIMSELFSRFIKDLLTVFEKSTQGEEKEQLAVMD